MSQEILDQYRDIVVVNATHIALEISLDLKARALHEQRESFAGNFATGFFYLHSIDKFPDTVFECIVSPNGDAITSVYKQHRVFSEPAELMRARDRLCHAIAEKVGMSIEGVGVDDEARGRTLGLNDLSTGQLVDMLAERMGQSIMVTNSHSAAGVGGLSKE